MAAIIIVAAMATTGLLSLATDDSHALNGSGSQSDPYILSSESDLSKLNDGLGSAGQDTYFKLDSDITVVSAWTPVGTQASPFMGHLDGQGHSIALGSITPSQYTGFFGCLNGADIKNLQIRLNNGASPLNTGASVYVGGLAGQIQNSTLYNVSSVGADISLNVTGSTAIYAGGLAGQMTGSTVTYAFSKVVVNITGRTSSSDSYAGGLIGDGANNTIDASFSTGNVTLEIGHAQTYTGGFIGRSVSGSITRSYETGAVKSYNTDNSNGAYAYTGGFVGYSSTQISDAYSLGNVHLGVDKDAAQGGFVGGFAGSAIVSPANVYSVGSVESNLKSNNGSRHQGSLTGQGTAADSHYDTAGTVTPNSNNSSGTGLSDTAIKNENNFNSSWKDGDWLWNGTDYPMLSALSFSITVNMDPTSGYGSVRYAKNSSATSSSAVYSVPLHGTLGDTFYLLAEAADAGKTFLRWSGGDEPNIFSTATYVTVPVPGSAGPLGSRTVTAYFEDKVDAALLTLNAVPAGSGSFTFSVDGVQGEFSYGGPQYFAKGTDITVTAASAGGYSFEFWVVDESWNTSNVTPAMTLLQDRTLTAVFVTATDPTLTVSADSPGSGSFTYEIETQGGEWIGPIDYAGPTKIPSGLDVRVTGFPDHQAGYLQVSSWNGATVDVNNNAVATMNGDKSIVATFERGVIYTLTSVPSGSGSLTATYDRGWTDGSGIFVVPSGSDFTPTAQDRDGYAFSYWAQWASAATGSLNRTMTLKETVDTELKAYFHPVDDSVSVTVAIFGSGTVAVKVAGTDAPLIHGENTGTVLKVARGADVKLTAADGTGSFIFFVGTINTTDREINIAAIDKDHTETAYFDYAGGSGNDLTVAAVGSGYATVYFAGWPEAVPTNLFPGNQTPAIKVNQSNPVRITAYEDGGKFQSFTVAATGSGDRYIYTTPMDHTVTAETVITANFTETSSTYVLTLSATPGNSITYSIGGSSPIPYSGTDGYQLHVDDIMDTVIGYAEGTGLFQHFRVDMTYSAPGPTLSFTDSIDHEVRAIFTDNKTDVYTLIVNVHGAGSIGLDLGNDPIEKISASGMTVTRTVQPDNYKGFSVVYSGGDLQYASWRFNGGSPEYDLTGAGINVAAGTDLPIPAGGIYEVDVYFTDSTDHWLYLDMVGSGIAVFDINGRGPVQITVGPATKIPLSSSDSVSIGHISGNFQYYRYQHGSVTEAVFTSPFILTGHSDDDHRVTVNFTESSTSFKTLSLGTVGHGDILYTIDSLIGRYRSPAIGDLFQLPLDASDIVMIGYQEDGSRFQLYEIDNVVVTSSPQQLTGGDNHIAIAYFTDTTSTFDLEVAVWGGGRIFVELTDNSISLEYSGRDFLVMPLDLTDEAEVWAVEGTGHFQYFRVGDQNSSPDSPDAWAVQGTLNGSGRYDYPFIVDSLSVSKKITALLTDNKSNEYALIVDVDPEDKGTIKYQIGNDPWVEFRGINGPRTLYVDPYEIASIGYDDTDANDGHFQYYVYQKNSESAESLFTIYPITGISGDTYTITAKFTKDKTNVSEHRLATIGDGYVTYQIGSDPVIKYDGPGISVWVDKDETGSITAHYEEYVPGTPLIQGYEFYELGSSSPPIILPPMPVLTLDVTKSYQVKVHFDVSMMTYQLIVSIIGGGNADISEGSDPHSISSYGNLSVHVNRNVSITASPGSGLFQGMKVRIDGTDTWTGTAHTIGSNTVQSGGTAYVFIYFTTGTDVYFLDVDVEGFGSVTYNINGTGVREVPLSQKGIPVDRGHNVVIGYIEGPGKFQYFVRNGDMTYTGFSIAGGTQTLSYQYKVVGHFTTTNDTYDLVMKTVGGSGMATYTFSGGGPTVKVSGGPYTIPVDETVTTTVSWEETASDPVPHFQYIRYAHGSSVTPHRVPFEISASAGEVHEAVAHFTSGSRYILSLSTNMGDGRGEIGVYIDSDITIWWNGTSRFVFPVDTGSGAKVIERDANGAEFQFFVLDDVPMFLDELDTDSYAHPNQMVEVIAYFATTVGSYAVDLSTEGPGSITYIIDGYGVGRFQTTSPEPNLGFRLNADTSLTIGNSPDAGAAFTYYIHSVNGGAKAVSMNVNPAVAAVSHSITAKFAGSGYYTVKIGATGGTITYQVGSDPVGSYSGVAMIPIHVDDAYDVVIDCAWTPNFQWFVHTVGNDTPVMKRDRPMQVPHSDQTVLAVFVQNPYFVTLKTEGGGKAVITLGSNTYSYRSPSPGTGDRIPVDPSMQAQISYSEDIGQHFQQFDHRVGMSVQSYSGPFAITGSAGEDHELTAYFTSGSVHYRIDLSRIGGGLVTYTVGTHGTVGIGNAPGSPFRLWVDEGDQAVIGNSPQGYSFQYYEYSGGAFAQGPIIDATLSFPAGTAGEHSVTAYFTSGSGQSTYMVDLGTDGDGYITFRLDTMTAGEYAKYRSTGASTYSLWVDNGKSVRIGYEEDQASSVYFIGFTQDGGTIIRDESLTVYSGGHTVIAHFTGGGDVYTVDLSTDGAGSITYTYGSGLTGQFRTMIGTPYITVHVNIAEKLTIGHTNNTGEHFNAFIKDGVTVVGQDTIVYQPAQSEHHEVKAVFTDTSDVYEAVLSTVGSGYISFEVAGKLSGTYSGPGYSLYVDVTNALDIGNEPDDSFFQYYEIVQGPSRTIDIGPELTVPAGSQGSRGIIAFFTDDDTTGYAVTLSTKGNGYITFSLDGGVTTGRFMSSGQTQTYVLHADALDTVTIGNIPMAGHFQFFVYNGSLDVAKTAAGSFDVTENAVAEACFTSTGSTYSLTMAPVGGGHVDFSLGHGTYSIYSIITIPADSGTTVAASAVADAGVFRFNVYDSETYLQSSINMNESGGAHVLTSYFTADASLTEYLTVGITGEGRVDLDIVTVGTPIPTIRGFIGSVPMEPTDSVTLSAVETSPRYVFDSWAEDADGEPRVFTVTMSGDYGATAVFMYKGNPDRPSYVITATSSTDTVISPNGKISVLQGDGITFEFHANDGYIIATVQVDGTALSKEEVESGRYTFSDVNSNHTIHVVGMGTENVILLVIDIVGGEGVPKYSIGQSQYRTFVRTQPILLHSDLNVSLDIDEGYRFAGWTGYVESDDLELHFPDVEQAIHLVAHLESDSPAVHGEWAAVNLILAIMAVLTGLFAFVAAAGRWREDEEKPRTAMLLGISALAIGIVSLAVFFLTEDLGLSMGTVDRWTPLAAILFVASAILMTVGFMVERRGWGRRD